MMDLQPRLPKLTLTEAAAQLQASLQRAAIDPRHERQLLFDVANWQVALFWALARDWPDAATIREAVFSAPTSNREGGT